MHGPGSTAKTGAKKDPLKTPPSHGFRGFAAIESGAKSRRFSGCGCGSVNGRGTDDCGRDTGCLQAVCRKSAASLLRRSLRPSALKAKSRKPRPAQPHGPGFCGLAGRFRGLSRNRPKAWFLFLQPAQTPPADACMARLHCKNRSKKRPPKNASIARVQGLCCYQRRSEIGRFPVCGFGSVNGRGADDCGRDTGRLQAVCRKSAASLLRRSSNLSALKAKSQKPKARPAQPHGRAFAAWPGVFRAFPATGPRLGFCTCKPPKACQRTRAWPRLHCKNRSKKRPPENASIARFQGLYCYRIRSEIKAVFGGGIGFRRFADGWPGGWGLR